MSHCPRGVACLALAGAVALLLEASESQLVRASASYQLIVSASNPAVEISRDEVARCFMGERRRWQTGDPVVPVDLSATSPVRSAFSADVLGLSVDAVRIRWMKLISAGRARPPLTASEDEILKAVGQDRRALGYVSADAALPADVKPIRLLD